LRRLAKYRASIFYTNEEMENLLEFAKNQRNDSWLHFVVILLICYVSLVLPIQIIGVPSALDMETNLRFAAAFQDAFASGNLFPSWANDNFGYGSIGIRFYPPLSLFLLAVTQLLTNDWFVALIANLYFWLLVGCVGIYLFVKEWGTPVQGLLAASLFAVVPQHVAEVFQAFAFAEYAAWSILPYCFLFVTRICRGGTWKDTFLFAVAFSLLILTHIPTTIIATFSLPVYVLSIVDWRKFRTVSVSLISALVITLLATSFRWILLLKELTWVQHNGPENYEPGFYNFNSWLFPSSMMSHSFLWLETAGRVFDVTIVITLLLAVPAFFYCFTSSDNKSSSNRKVIAASLMTAIFSFFMLSRMSYYVWSNIVFLQKIQFPTRWLSVLSLSCVVSFALAMPKLLREFPRYSRLIIYPALAVVVAMMVHNAAELVIPSGPLTNHEMARIDVKLKSEPIWKSWWPVWAKKEALENSERVVAGPRGFEVTSWEPESKEFTVLPGKAQTIVVKNFYYPLWKATVNGQPVVLGLNENGVITIPISAERSTVRLSFEEPLIYGIANAISFVTWFVLFGILVVVYGWYGNRLGRKTFRMVPGSFSSNAVTTSAASEIPE
jgi:uncharacterized membrane protein